jgi:hypothetical protein
MAKTRLDLPDFDPSEMFSYRNGNLFWKSGGRGRTIGKKIGSLLPNGYVFVQIKGRYFMVHRLIYLMHHKTWPEYIDHIDCNKSNNKIENLREITKSLNALNVKVNKKNNSSGFNGVYWSNRSKKWIAQVSRNHKTKYIGGFDTPVKAAEEIQKYLSTKPTQGEI